MCVFIYINLIFTICIMKRNIYNGGSLQNKRERYI